MSRLNIITFGKVDININGEPVKGLSARKTQALLVYLAVTRQKHSRQALATLFWGEMLEEKARRNLRVAVTRIPNAIKEFLIIKHRTLAIDPDKDINVDCLEFESCLSGPSQTFERLERAAELYQGPFLDDFILRDAPSFDEWAQPIQERYRQMAMEAFYRLAQYQTEQRQYSSAIDQSQRLLLLEPWMEEAHRQLMYLYAVTGQRTAALNQFENCKNILWEELAVEPSAETTNLHLSILNEELLADPQPTPKFTTHTTGIVKPIQIPATTDHFVGRSSLIKTIVKELTSEGGSSIHALVGMGGIGKSTLAIQIAMAVQDEFPDGILWAHAASSEPMSILGSWAAAYGYDFTKVADLESLAASFRGILADKKVLLVFDDVVGSSRIRRMLPGGKRNRVLFTTRDQDVAQILNSNVWQVNELSSENGRLLLASILGDNRVAAEPDAANIICTILQNLPLALEITAQRLKSRPQRLLIDMAHRLQNETQRLSLLQISDYAVRASFEISWQTLDRELRRFFSLIAVFGNRTFSAPALAEISTLDKYSAEDRLFNLTALSLVQEKDNGRYQVHSLLADFATEKLGPEPEPYLKMARYYQNFAEEFQQDYDALTPEWNNLMASIETASKFDALPLVIVHTKALTKAWFARGRYADAVQGNQLAYEAAEKLNDKNAMAEFLYFRAHALVEQSLYNEAQAFLLKCLGIFEEIGDKSGSANAYFDLYRIDLELSNHEAAEQSLQKSRQLREEIEDRVGIAETIEGQARLTYQQGYYQEAYELSQKALKIYELAAYDLGIIETLRTIVDCIIERQNHGLGQKEELKTAKNYCERALDLAEMLQERGEKAVTLLALSRVYSLQQNFVEAELTGRQSLDLLKQIGDQRSQGIVMTHLGEVFYRQGNYETALEITYQGLDFFQRLIAPTSMAVALANIGVFHQSLNQPNHARKAWIKALIIAEKLDHTTLVGRLKKRLQPE